MIITPKQGELYEVHFKLLLDMSRLAPVPSAPEFTGIFLEETFVEQEMYNQHDMAFTMNKVPVYKFQVGNEEKVIDKNKIERLVPKGLI